MKPSDLECLAAACDLMDGCPDALGTGGMRAAARGLRLIDAAIARNLRQHRRLEHVAPLAADGVLRAVERQWPKLLRGLRSDVARVRRNR